MQGPYQDGTGNTHARWHACLWQVRRQLTAYGTSSSSAPVFVCLSYLQTFAISLVLNCTCVIEGKLGAVQLIYSVGPPKLSLIKSMKPAPKRTVRRVSPAPQKGKPSPLLGRPSTLKGKPSKNKDTRVSAEALLQQSQVKSRALTKRLKSK